MPPCQFCPLLSIDVLCSLCNQDFRCLSLLLCQAARQFSRALRRQAGVQRSVKIQIRSCWAVFETVLSAQKNGAVSGNPVLADTALLAKRPHDLACLLCPAARAGAGKDFMSVGSLLQAWIELDDTGKYGRLYFQLRGCPLLDAQRNTSQKVLNLTQHSHQIFLGSRLGLG